MGIIERASIYKLVKKGKILIHGVSSLQMGAGIASEPFIWLEETTPQTLIIDRLFYALGQTKTGLTNPTDWKESSKQFLQNIGLKKQSDLYKDCLHVGVLKKDDKMLFTPTKNQGSKGFINVSKEKMEISEKASTKDIVRALQVAFDKCL